MAVPALQQTSVPVRESVNPAAFRHVLGHVPTSVAVVTAMVDGVPTGMTVGSFTSVSLDPPLVAFFAGYNSGSVAGIRQAGSFCVNVLTEDQQQICQTFAARGVDRFADIAWRVAGNGTPRLDGAMAWVECDLESVVDAGDHVIVMGRVTRLEAGRAEQRPMVFFNGGLCRLHPGSVRRTAWQSVSWWDE